MTMDITLGMTLGTPMVPLPPLVDVVVALEPVDNILMSLAALRDPDQYGGIDAWVLTTTAQLPETVRRRHQFWMKWLWLDVLTNLVDRQALDGSFPSYLTALASQEPVALRNRILTQMLNSVHFALYAGANPTQPLTTVEQLALLNDIDRFTAWVEARFTEKPTEVALTDIAQFHRLLNAPQQLRDELVTHLQWMWNEVVAPEWQRTQPRLQHCVDAFNIVPLTGHTMLEAMALITGRDVSPAFRIEALSLYRRVRFIPTIHNGPYIVWFGDEEELRIGFPAHAPPAQYDPMGQWETNEAIDHSTLVNRLKALADETRLALLWALQESGELTTQEVIDRFQLDKSAASRHLRQLVANDLIVERRAEGAKKIYQPNPQAFDLIQRMLNRLATLYSR